MPRPFLTAEWRSLVMLNYEAEPDLLRPFVPGGVEPDVWAGRTFVSVVGFVMQKTRVRGCPIPGHRDFEEVNLRFYVRRSVGPEVRRGVVFIKEVAPRRAIALVARRVYHEPYEYQPMGRLIEPPRGAEPGQFEYRWAGCAVGATVGGDPEPLEPGSEAEFITERYWGYNRQRDGRTLEYRVEHPPWRVWAAEDFWLTGPVGQFYGPPFERVFDDPPSSAFVAEGSPVAVYPGEPLPTV